MRLSLSLVVLLSGVMTAGAQTLPPLMPYTGALTETSGDPRTAATGVIFGLYEEPTGGVPLWVEMEVVKPDRRGIYSVVLGSTTGGVPMDLFANGRARWLGVQVEGQAEQTRVLLASVPYAFKAGDAETLGGLPLSAFATVDVPGERSDSGARATTKADRDSADRALTRLQSIGGDLAVTGHLITQGAGDDYGVVINRTNDPDHWRLQQRGDGALSLQYRTLDSRASRLTVDPAGHVGIGITDPTEQLEVAGAVKANSFVGDGSGLTNLPTGIGNAFRVVDSLGQFVGTVVPGMSQVDGATPITRQTRGRWVVFYATRDEVFSYLHNQRNLADFYYTDTSCNSSARLLVNDSLFTTVGGRGNILYVPGDPERELLIRSSRQVRPGERFPCLPVGQVLNVEPYFFFDLSDFVPPFRVVQ